MAGVDRADAAAQRLASAVNLPLDEIEVHHFPDRESRIRALSSAETVLVYCSLNDPNAKLIELALAAAAYRDLQAKRLVLVAPYLCYMRQDAAFRVGEAVSQRVIARFLAQHFDRIVTIAPHLHRTTSLSEIFPDTECTSLAVTSLLEGLLKGDAGGDDAIAVGPDFESRNWVEPLAANAGIPWMTLQKTRKCDDEVVLEKSNLAAAAGRRVYLVDDVLSTGQSLAQASRLLLSGGAASVEALVVHALCSEGDLARLRRAGIHRVRSTDTVPHSTNAVSVAALLAAALRSEC